MSKNLDAKETLRRILDVISYPVSTDILSRGWDIKHDIDSVTYAAELAIDALSASQEAAAPSEEPVAWKEFDHETIDYVLRYGGRCRECADRLGLCHNGLPCDVDDAKTAIRWVLKALNYGISNGFLASPAVAPVAGETERLVRASQWLQDRWCQKHPNTAHIRQLADYEAFLAAGTPDDALNDIAADNEAATDEAFNTWKEED